LYQEYINLHISIPEEEFDLATALLSTLAIVGIEERFDELVVCFKIEDYNEETKLSIVESFLEHIPKAKLTKVERISDKNWNEEWEKNTKSIIVNDRIGIAPEWRIDEINNPIKIIINPKMSFGTGEHSTTRLVAILMDKILKKNSKWIDAGCGSGILAILAIKLGAESVFAFDNDIWSVENTKENTTLNLVSDKIDILQASVDSILLPSADGICANLFAHLLIASFPIFYKSLESKRGDLIVSGILKYDADDVKQKAIESGFKFIESIFEDDWVAIHFRAEK
jgi:ribosomal protein L11 methyltransferase